MRLFVFIFLIRSTPIINYPNSQKNNRDFLGITLFIVKELEAIATHSRAFSTGIIKRITNFRDNSM